MTRRTIEERTREFQAKYAPREKVPTVTISTQTAQVQTSLPSNIRERYTAAANLSLLAIRWATKTRELLEKAMETRTLSIPVSEGRFFEIKAPKCFSKADMNIVMETLRLWEPMLISHDQGMPDSIAGLAKQVHEIEVQVREASDATLALAEQSGIKPNLKDDAT